ncbi:DeoR/GlpR family DNA-binding transcription regulator [Aliirhizobium smilacinae]|uniref:DeoR/GlpR transcriptional regulator n=1 Tax=Aliirhizobium smilacinae TaxID=1395944 RepID=A0A5C4XRX2_9HYPH|nr:DeoR/GlpR family DNA-binding transcription regulator [Rhizobium smilacinae]TNM65344.1 DeoR/GlpR transcriptional regulator [Rhizobium smilacinae]
MSEQVNKHHGRLGSALSAERQQRIVDLATQGQAIAVSELADEFQVSAETIRRDIRSVEEAGHVRRVHGGAVPTRAIDLTARRPVIERLDVDRETKILAAQAAVALFEDDMSVFIGSSSTMLILADELSLCRIKLRITTNMIDVATRLAGVPACSVQLVGGTVVPATRSISGPEVFRALEKRVFDLSICGVSAIDAVHGFMGPSTTQATFGEVLAERSHQLVYVADEKKFGRSDSYIINPLTAATAVATNRVPEKRFVDALSAAKVALLLPPMKNENGVQQRLGRTRSKRRIEP